jgi:hypothetical protein
MKTALLFIIPAFAALLGALGGSRNSSKLFRRLGIPVLVAIAALCLEKYWYLASAAALIGVLSMGYGETSWLRRMCDGDDAATRMVYGMFFMFCFLPAFSSVVLAVMAIVATGFVFGMFGVMLKNEPVIEIGKLQLLVEDMIVYGVGTLFGVGLMIG